MNNLYITYIHINPHNQQDILVSTHATTLHLFKDNNGRFLQAEKNDKLRICTYTADKVPYDIFDLTVREFIQAMYSFDPKLNETILKHPHDHTLSNLRIFFGCIDSRNMHVDGFVISALQKRERELCKTFEKAITL